ncbi:MAG: hypothetical protein H6742_11115 [Alphaproteobacteria bacterium]|nr:hypothetical protein [Alphaproteobacteria bacterium]
MRGELVQILATCPTCRVEAAVVELVEIGQTDSLVVEGRCRMCGRQEEHGTILEPGRRVWTRAAVLDALVRWAGEDGETDLDAFIQSGFSGRDLDGVVAALQAGRPIETSFDVVAWLFPGMGGGGGAMGVADGDLARAAEAGPKGGGGVLARTPGDRTDAPASDEPAADPDALARLPLRALSAVMLADGVIRPGERQFLDGFAARLGLDKAAASDLRPWRPADLPWPTDPEPILRAMVELAFVDAERDGSEWRVVREFARHWGYPLADLEALGRQKEEALASAMTRLWRALRRLFVVEDPT